MGCTSRPVKKQGRTAVVPAFAGMFANKTGCAAARKSRERAAASQSLKHIEVKNKNALGEFPGAFFLLTIYKFIMDVLDACNDQTSRMQQGYSSAVAMP